MKEKQLVSFDGTKITYFISKNSKSPLLFLHGWPHNHTVWHQEIKHFSQQGFSIVAPDLRGHGKSGKPEEKSDYTLDKFAKDIQAIIQKEKLEQVTLVGHSFGGMVALSCYKLFPRQIKSLILIDTIYENPLKHLPVLKKIEVTPFTKKVIEYIFSHQSIKKKHFAQVDFSKFKDHQDFFYWLQGAKQTPIKSVLASLDAMLNFNIKADLPSIKIPTLIIVGENDNKTPPSSAKQMVQLIPNSTLKIIPNASHDTNIRNSKQLIKEIEHFIQP